MSMYSSRASVLRWQERNAGLTISSTSQSIALEAFPQKIEAPSPHDGKKNEKFQGLFSMETIPCLIAIIFQLIAILIIVVFNLIEVTIKMPGILSNDARALYCVCITVIAIGLTAFVSKQIKSQWLHFIEMRRIRKADTAQSSRRIEHLLGVGPYWDYFYYWGTSLSFIFASLSTAALVTALIPSTGYRTFPTTARLTPGTLNCTSISEAPLGDAISWELNDGTTINYGTRGNTCLGDPAFSVASKVSTAAIERDGYAYNIAGVGITRSSIGVPYDAHNGHAGFDKIFWDTGDLPVRHDRGNFQESTQCLPVFVRNPVSCRRAGTVVPGRNNLTVQLDDNCSVSTPIFGVDLTNDGASASGFCVTNKTVGTITFLLGSVNYHAGILATSVGDFPAVNAKSYSIACDVDIASAVEFRETTISRTVQPPYESTISQQSLDINPVADFTIYSSSQKSSCTPNSYTAIWNPNNVPATVLTPGALAVGAAAAYPLFTQNRYNDGWWDSLYRSVKSRKSTSFGFKDSENALEDILGLISAISVGQYVGSAQEPVSNRDTPPILNRNGSARLLGYRIGSGSPWGLFFIAPQVWTICLLLFLLIRRVSL